MFSKFKNSEAGAVILPLSILLVLLGLGIVLTQSLLPQDTDVKRIENMDETLATSEEALTGFVVQHFRLPCPDTDQDGFENCATVPGNVSITLGDLPYRTMGFPHPIIDSAAIPIRYAPYRNTNATAAEDADLAAQPVPNRYVPDIPTEFVSAFENQDLLDTCTEHNTAENQAAYTEMVNDAGGYASGADQAEIEAFCMDENAQLDYINSSCDYPDVDAATVIQACEDSADIFNMETSGLTPEETQQYCDDNNIDPCEPCDFSTLDIDQMVTDLEELEASCIAQLTPEVIDQRLDDIAESCDNLSADLGADTLGSADMFGFCDQSTIPDLSEPPVRLNLFDFCVGLENAISADSSTAFPHTTVLGNTSNAAWALISGGLQDTDGDGNDRSFDGENEGTDLGFDSSIRGRETNVYDDRVLAKTYAALQREYSCVPLLGAMRALAALATEAVSEVGDAESDLLMAYISMITGIIQVANSTFSLANAIAVAVGFAKDSAAATACAATVLLAPVCVPAATAAATASTAFVIESVAEGVALVAATIELGVTIANVVQAHTILDTTITNANGLVEEVFAADLRGGLR